MGIVILLRNKDGLHQDGTVVWQLQYYKLIHKSDPCRLLSLQSIHIMQGDLACSIARVQAM